MQIIIITGGIILFIGLAIMFYVIWQNTGSKNLILAFSAVCGSIMLLVINMLFDLRQKTTSNYIPTQLTVVYKEKPEITQFMYSHENTIRAVLEKRASEELASSSPELFKKDSLKATKDMIMYCLAGFFLNERNWIKEIRQSNMSQITYFPSKEGSDKNSHFISKEFMQNQLKKVGNLFADTQLNVRGSKGIYLPPESKLEIKEDNIILSNPYFNMTFKLTSSNITSYFVTDDRVSEYLKTEKAKIETHEIYIDVIVKYSALLAQNKEMSSYKQWCEYLISNAKKWFDVGHDVLSWNIMHD